MKDYIASLRAYLERHGKHVPTLALIAGFGWDILTLGRPDQIYGNILIIVYFVLAGGSIFLLNVRKARGEEGSVILLLALMQFSFGSLASALLIFYGQSGTLAGNWLFLALFAGLLVGNELVRNRYSLALFHVGVFYFLSFAYLALILPVALGEMGLRIFLISGGASLLFIALFLAVLFFAAPRLMKTNAYSTALTIAGAYGALNLLFALNLIPPVPLSLRDIGVFQHVARTGPDSYEILYESEAPKLIKYSPFYSSPFHFILGQRAYCFSAVFAPAGLDIPVLHRWERFNEELRAWQTEALISFPIRGGREGGYRGYTIKEIETPGEWRCDVETENGLLIGRQRFTAIAVDTPLSLSPSTR